MNQALAATALLLGVAGAPHCAAMCGAACAGVVRAAGSRWPAILALLAGRMASYAAAGAVLGGGVALLGEWSTHAEALRPVWVALHACALVLGLWLLGAGRQPAWLARIGGIVAAAPGPVRPLRRMNPTAAAAMAGALWIVLPCGLLQSALLVAALGAGVLDGAALMVLFALGSSVGLLAGPAIWNRVAGSAPHMRQWLVRVAGLLLAVAAGFAIAQLLGAHNPLCT
jgi:sulfite exporter TauE/SafE